MIYANILRVLLNSVEDDSIIFKFESITTLNRKEKGEKNRLRISMNIITSLLLGAVIKIINMKVLIEVGSMIYIDFFGTFSKLHQREVMNVIH